MNLKYICADAPSGHPQKVMRELGVTYQHSTPQSLYDQWWFWNCDGVPEKLPEYLQMLNLDPMEFIGYGISEDVAKSIVDLTKKRK